MLKEIPGGFLSVQQEFKERSGSSLCIFQEMLKLTSKLVATYEKCQDKNKGIFQALHSSGFLERCWVVTLLVFIGV